MGMKPIRPQAQKPVKKQGVPVSGGPGGKTPVLDVLEGHWQQMFFALLYKLSPSETVKITNIDLLQVKAMTQMQDPFILYTHGHDTSIEFGIMKRSVVQSIAKKHAESGGFVDSAQADFLDVKSEGNILSGAGINPTPTAGVAKTSDDEI